MKKEGATMRDIKRIDPIIAKLRELWHYQPDLRLGQLFYIIADKLKCNDIFFVEEPDWDKAMQSLLENAGKRFDRHNDNCEHECKNCAYSDNATEQLPCVICRGTEILGLDGYKRPCYFVEKIDE